MFEKYTRHYGFSTIIVMIICGKHLHEIIGEKMENIMPASELMYY